MATIKEQYQESQQRLYEDIAAAIEHYQVTTGVVVECVKYVHNAYAKPPQLHFMGFSLKTDLD